MKMLLRMCVAIAVLAAVYAAAGLFSTGGDGVHSFTTLHGQTVEIYGQGIYRNDTAFKAPILRGTDAVTLFVAVPVLLASVYVARRGTLRGRIWLTAVLAYFLYNSASLAMGAAFNPLLPVYIACASLSLFAFIIAFASIDLKLLAARTTAKFPHRAAAVFLFLAGLSLVVWIMDIAIAIANGSVPATLGPYHTETTYVLDLGVILPAAWLAMALVWRRSPLGTLLACVLITLNLSVGLAVASQSIMQALGGIILTPGEYAAYVAPFVTLSVVAGGLVVRMVGEIEAG